MKGREERRGGDDTREKKEGKEVSDCLLDKREIMQTRAERKSSSSSTFPERPGAFDHVWRSCLRLQITDKENYTVRIYRRKEKKRRRILAVCVLVRVCVRVQRRQRVLSLRHMSACECVCVGIPPPGDTPRTVCLRLIQERRGREGEARKEGRKEGGGEAVDVKRL